MAEDAGSMKSTDPGSSPTSRDCREFERGSESPRQVSDTRRLRLIYRVTQTATTDSPPAGAAAPSVWDRVGARTQVPRATSGRCVPRLSEPFAAACSHPSSAIPPKARSGRSTGDRPPARRPVRSNRRAGTALYAVHGSRSAPHTERAVRRRRPCRQGRRGPVGPPGGTAWIKAVRRGCGTASCDPVGRGTRCAPTRPGSFACCPT